MKVGLLQRPGTRYGRYWQTFLKELGLEVQDVTHSPAELYRVGRDSLPDAPVTVQLALGQVLAQERLDILLVIDSPAVPQDAWGMALTELLPRRISGLPQLLRVPDGGPDLESAATELGQRLSHNAGLVRLALDKVRPFAKPPRLEMPPLSMASRATIAVIGLPSVLEDDFLMSDLRAKLAELSLHAVYASHLPPDQVETRGLRGQDGRGRPLEAGERDLFGAQNLLEGKSAVRGLLYLVAERDAATHEALLRLQQKAHKPTLLLSLNPDAPDLSALERFAQQVTAGASSRAAETDTPPFEG